MRLDTHCRHMDMRCKVNYLDCTETAMGLAALTVEAGENTNFPICPRLAASSSR